MSSQRLDLAALDAFVGPNPTAVKKYLRAPLKKIKQIIRDSSHRPTKANESNKTIESNKANKPIEANKPKNSQIDPSSVQDASDQHISLTTNVISTSNERTETNDLISSSASLFADFSDSNTSRVNRTLVRASLQSLNAAQFAARTEILLPSKTGELKADKLVKTWKLKQEDLVKNVDGQTQKKVYLSDVVVGPLS